MATVLKHDSLVQPSDVTRIVAFNIEDVQTRGNAYLAQIKRQASQILDEAHQNSATIRQQAYDEGREAALADVERTIEERSLQLSDQRCRAATAACQKSLEELNQETSKWLQSWRDTTIDLAIAMAEKLVRQSMAAHSEPLQLWMEEALQLMRDTREIRILVHPDDFSVAGRYLQQMAKTIPHAADAEVIPDPEISPGGCVVKSKYGQIDQQLQTQLSRLGDQLR